MRTIYPGQSVGSKIPPPYGPTKGMLEGLQLLQRVAPTRVDEVFLRSHGVAPGNEYKVVGALRFLGLIDEQGRPTERCRLLRTRGATFTLALQEIIHEAYHDLFAAVDPSKAKEPRDQVFNYFVTQAGMGPEMATKAARFFLSLCQRAEIAMEPEPPRRRGRRPGSGGAGRAVSRTVRRGAARTEEAAAAAPANIPLLQAPFVFALTPDMASLSDDELTALLRKLGNAMRRAFPGAA